MSKHTPGPWIIIDDSRCFKEIKITTEGREKDSVVSICEMDLHFRGIIGDEQNANARLIAAAPELLKALEMIANMDSMSYHSLESAKITARAAIAKATGGQQ